MKILMLTSSLRSGGAETHICELARALAARGHEVLVASSGGDMVSELTRHRISHIRLPLNSKRPFGILISAVRLKKLVSTGGFDVVHLHSRTAAFIFRLSMLGEYAPPTVSTVHAHFKTDLILKRLSFWGNAAIAVSDDLKYYLSKEYGFPQGKIRVIPNAIDTELFSPSQKTENNAAPPRIIFVSRLDTDCSLGALLLCRIAPRLAQKYKGITIEIAGGGKAYKKISAEAAAANKAVGYECVTLCGRVKNVSQRLSTADIFVGVSRAALEAMSSALPVVLCGNEGFIGILDSSSIDAAESTNFCCRGSELPSYDALFKSLCALLEMSSAERRALGNFLRDYVCRSHSLSALAEETENFYREAILKTPQKHARTVLCGYYGFGNLGDEALLECAIERIRKESKSNSISVICHSPREIRRRYGVRTVRRENILAVRKELRGAATFVLGGGSILQDSTSYRSLRYYTHLILYAARKGASVELLANGLGPLVRRRSKRLVSKALSVCVRASFRDRTSAALAQSLGLERKRTFLEDDLFSSVPLCDKKSCERLQRELLGNKSNMYFLVGIRGDTKRRLKRDMIKETELHKKCGLLPVFVAMHPREDGKLAGRLAKRLGGRCAKDLSPSELLTLTSMAQSVITNRYHLLYAARLQGIPAIPFGDDPKLLSLRSLN